MKKPFKILSFLILFCAVFSVPSFVLAVDCISWDYSSWSSCEYYEQTRWVVNSYPIDCSGGIPNLNKYCVETGVVSGSYNCAAIEDLVQAGICQSNQDNITWKNMVLDFGFSVMVLILVFFVILIFYKIVLKPLLNIFRNVR